MNLAPLDYLIILGALALSLGAAIYTSRYSRSVADFLSANRCAGRYLLTVSGGMASLGAVSIVALWEQFYEGGFGTIHWLMMQAPLGLLLALSGFVVYRYRQTRALTFAQFLEMRYSRRFRVFAGFLCFVSGVLNYGIFPAVTGRFLIYFLNLPIIEGNVFGLDVNWTLGIVMACTLTASLIVTLNGGQIALMVSDFVQGQLVNICFVTLMGVLLWLIPWPTMIETLKTAPPGKSMLNPFDQGALPDFNPFYFIMLVVMGVYQYRVWQGSQGYNAAARSPHEAKMAGVLGEFRALIVLMVVPLGAIAAWVLLHGSVQPEAASATKAHLDVLCAAGDGQLAKQLTTTIALRELLPAGVLGMLAALMIMASVATDATYLHSWGSIFVQDILLPLRQFKGMPRLSPDAHLKSLKVAIFSVAAFAWVFSMVFPLQQYILMYFMLTGAIFIGGAGAVQLGGLYWRRGTTGGAWTAMIVGSSLSVVGVVVINLIWPAFVPWAKGAYPGLGWAVALPERFWLNGMQWSFLVAIISCGCYVAVSLLWRGEAADFDKLFHRGKFAVDAPEGVDYVVVTSRDSIPGWLRKLGINEEFTTGDKVIFGLKYLIFFWQFGVGFVGLTVAYLVFGAMRSLDSWAAWWTIFLWVTATVAISSTVWFLIGGIRDLFAMFKMLRSIHRDAADDGTVTGPTNKEPSREPEAETVLPR